jgi:predicted PurR-regulated permease PerM
MSDVAKGDHARGRSAQETRWAARGLDIVAALLVAVGLAPVAVGLAGAVALYEMCRGPHAWLVRRLNSRFAAVLMVCLALVVVAGPLLWLGEHLSARLPSVVAKIQTLQTTPDSAAVGAMARIGPMIGNARDAATKWLPGALLSAGGSMAWALLNWSIALLGLYYLLGSASDVWAKLASVLPFSSASAETLRVRLHDSSVAIIAGTLLSAAVQGASIGFGFFLAGLPEALFWSVAAAIATLVPLVGNALVWLPALLYMVVMRRYEGAIAIGILGGLAPPIIDRVVRATTSSRMGSVHPMITLVGAIAGMRVAGVAGLVLGPVALAMFFTLVDVYRRDYFGVETTPTNSA